MSSIIGIDFGHGATKSAYCDETGHAISVSVCGSNSVPSCVALGADKVVKIGDDARQMNLVDPDCVVSGFKRYLDDPTKRFFKGVASAVDVLAMFLRVLITLVEEKTGFKVTGAVFTCPVTFNDAQKNGIRQAAEQAGIKVEQILTEPEAAGFAYICKDGPGVGRVSHYFVCDVGHGTTDLTVLKIEDGIAKAVAIEGLEKTGGHALTDGLQKFVLDKLAKLIGKPVDISKLSPQEAAEFREKIEQLKHRLSTQASGMISLNFGGKTQMIEILQSEFDAVATAPLMQKVKSALDRAIKSAGKSWKDIEKLVLAGAPFHNKRLQAAIADYTGLVPRTEIDCSVAVSYGAALQAYHLGRKADGKGPLPGSIEFERSSTIDLGVCMIDKSSGTRQEVCWRMVPKGASLEEPFKDDFRLERPNQTEVTIAILQGSHGAKRSDCLCIGEIRLEGLPPEPVLTARITLVYEFDSDSIVKVTATDKISGKSKSVSIKLNSKQAA